MIKPLPSLFTLLLLLCAAASQAQTHTLSGFTISNKKAITPIYEGNEVKGYTMLYREDRADTRVANYGVDFYDQDLQKVRSALFPKERHFSHLLRRAYNGKTFSFYFYNTRSKLLEMDVFDSSLNKIASKEFPMRSKADQHAALEEMQVSRTGASKPLSGMNLYAVPNKGFIRNGYTGNMKGFSLEMYDNNLNLKWTYTSDGMSKNYESLLVHEVTDKYILATIARRSGKVSKKLNFFVAAFDVETGDNLLDVPVENDNTQQLSVSSFSFDEKKKEFIAMGEFYSVEDKELEDQSKGFYVKRMGMNGKENFAKFFGWEKDVNPLLPQEAKKSLKEGYENFVHKIIRGADGKQHIVVEQYKVKADGVGIALAVLGGGTSTVKGVIGNMLIYTLGPDLSLEKVSFFEKDQTDCILPPGAGAYGAGLLGLVINMNGGFDYQFTQEDNSQTSFSTAYINYKKVKKSKFREKTLVNIMYAGNMQLKSDNIDVSSSNEVVSFVYPAKPGYVLVLDRQSGEEKLEMKLVKLN
ncbi:hypothetical protein DXT99_14325 [Pontibacter diazotrophicus]|uniref:Uncharacterized protein n=1 Tax=Pontibacter diazotrophicus TaxID=1400979 RepID=A0A3D8LAV5_9BACT|nr:DUF6770 family protein [Pontibacter diazotrophicus]RDV14571.1 hypothetical protein DXT99_14325 [Pontibacter diazotrophicus]